MNDGWLDLNAADAVAGTVNVTSTSLSVTGVYYADIAATTGSITVESGAGLWMTNTGVVGTAVTLDPGSKIGLVRTVYAEATLPGAGVSDYGIGDGQYSDSFGYCYSVSGVSNLVLSDSTRITSIPKWQGLLTNGYAPGIHAWLNGTGLVTTTGTKGRVAAIGGTYMEVSNPFDFTGATLLVGDVNSYDALREGGQTGFQTVSQDGTVRLINAANIFGAVEVQAGTLEVTGDVLQSSAVPTYGLVTLGESVTGSANATLLTVATTALGNDISVVAGAGTRTVGTGAGNGTFNGAVTLSKDVNLTAATGTTATFNGAITGTGNVTKIGNGTVVLANTGNAYNGETQVTAGTLRLGGSGVIPDASAVSVASGATFNMNSLSEQIGSLSGAGLVTMGNSTLTLGAAAGTKTFTGQITGGNVGLNKAGGSTQVLSSTNAITGTTAVGISDGTLRLTTATALPTTADVDLSGATARFEITTNVQIGSLTGVAGSVVHVDSSTLTFGGSGTFSGQIVGNSGAVTKVGTGAATLDGSYSFATPGTVSVDAGRLNLNTGTGSSNVTVNVNGVGAEAHFGAAQQLEEVNIAAGATGFIDAGSVLVNTFNLAKTGSDYTATLDMTDRFMAVSYTDAADRDAKLAMLVEAVNYAKHLDMSGLPQWDRAGITSSLMVSLDPNYTIAVADNAEFNAQGIGKPTWGGVVLPDYNNILVRYTFAGDANLDGDINYDDYTFIDLTIDEQYNRDIWIRSGWLWGDLDQNGEISYDDYTMLDLQIDQWQRGVLPPPLDPGSLVDAPQFGGKLAGDVAPVPEPATLSLLALGAVGFFLARRRRQSV